MREALIRITLAVHIVWRRRRAKSGAYYVVVVGAFDCTCSLESAVAVKSSEAHFDALASEIYNNWHKLRLYDNVGYSERKNLQLDDENIKRHKSKFLMKIVDKVREQFHLCELQVPAAEVGLANC